jgi:urease accessory protein
VGNGKTSAILGPGEYKPMTTPWQAHLQLAFARRGDSSALVTRRHAGPLVVQKALYPEGPAVCHAVVVHPPGGIAGGDQLAIDITTGENAQALLTTPGATQWYRRRGEHPASCQQLTVRVAPGASLEWLPQENIVFDGADAQLTTRLALTGNARAIGWEIVCLGRAAHGERFATGAFSQSSELFIDDRLIWREHGHFTANVADDGLAASPVGLDGRSVFGTLWLAGIAPDPALLAALREAAADTAAVTALPQITLVRGLATSSQPLRQTFIRCWQVARPRIIGHPARLPRLWAT